MYITSIFFEFLLFIRLEKQNMYGKTKHNAPSNKFFPKSIIPPNNDIEL